MCFQIASPSFTLQRGVKKQLWPPQKTSGRWCTVMGPYCCCMVICTVIWLRHTAIWHCRTVTSHCHTSTRPCHASTRPCQTWFNPWRRWILWTWIRLRFQSGERHCDLLQRWRGVSAPMRLEAFCHQGKYASVLFAMKSQNFLSAHLWTTPEKFAECERWRSTSVVLKHSSRNL